MFLSQLLHQWLSSSIPYIKTHNPHFLYWLRRRANAWKENFVISSQWKFKVPMKRNFLLSYSKQLSKWQKIGVYFIVIALLVAELFNILIYGNLDDLWRHSVDTKWCKITKYGIFVQILSLQGWNFAGLMCCKNYTFW